MHELRDLGAELVELSVGQLKRINLPENIFDAVRECQKITAHGARRRQIQYLGKLMRGVDDEPIRAGLALRGESSAETARLHRLERLRVRLLEDEAVLTEIAAQWPGVDLQHLRTLRRNALKEKENNKPPKNFRAIFQILQELDQKARRQPRKAAMSEQLVVGLVSISDRASTGVYEDKGIPALQEWLSSALTTPWRAETRLIADDQPTIEQALIELVDTVGCHLVLTTGGTGPARAT
jgi:ribosome-associated protein